MWRTILPSKRCITPKPNLSSGPFFWTLGRFKSYQIVVSVLVEIFSTRTSDQLHISRYSKYIILSHTSIPIIIIDHSDDWQCFKFTPSVTLSSISVLRCERSRGHEGDSRVQQPRWGLFAVFQEAKGEAHGGFHSHGGTPIAGWFIRGNPIKMDDLGVPLFQETSIFWVVRYINQHVDWWFSQTWLFDHFLEPIVFELHQLIRNLAIALHFLSSSSRSPSCWRLFMANQHAQMEHF